MKLTIAGGCGEHGRNCFFVEDKNTAFMVDCGIMPGAEDSYPHLSGEQIQAAEWLFITHSHNDHMGALDWLYENGFNGTVLLTSQTFSQLSKQPERFLFINELTGIQESMSLSETLSLRWGRSGQCVGSVWLLINFNGKEFFFSGDYIEDTLVYECDKLEGIYADVAVVDCAYGLDCRTAAENRTEILKFVKAQLELSKNILLPVPKHGRGLELYALLRTGIPGIPFYADENLFNQITDTNYFSDWAKPNAENYVKAKQLSNLESLSLHSKPAVIFLSDPQLNNKTSKELADSIINDDGTVLFTGHFDENSYGKEIMEFPSVFNLRYSVHPHIDDVFELCKKNIFKTIVPTHTAETRLNEKHAEWVLMNTGQSLVLD